jgi:hypothetical protein
MFMTLKKAPMVRWLVSKSVSASTKRNTKRSLKRLIVLR